ncbi:MAG: PRC-barrel domain-containing protein [Pirellulales bacterium]
MARGHMTRWLAVCVTLTWAASTAWGQVDVDVQVEDQAQQEEQQEVQQQPQQPDRAQQRLQRSANVHRASELIGTEVKNAQGEDLGEIHDLVVGMRSGRVRYAALSFGGFAGLGEKLFAIPFQGLQMATGEDDERHYVLNIPMEQFENAQGFEENNWPDLASPQWAAQIEGRYQIQARRDGQQRREQRQADRQQRQADEATDQAEPTRQSDQAAQGQRRGRQGDVGIRLSKVRGMNVRNDSNQEIGEIEDLVIDGQRGRVRYAALAFGQTLGLGGKLFAIPWNRLQLGQQDEEYHLVLNVSQQELESAQGFDRDAWPNTADAQWQQQIERNFPSQRRQRQVEQPERSDQ